MNRTKLKKVTVGKKLKPFFLLKQFDDRRHRLYLRCALICDTCDQSD